MKTSTETGILKRGGKALGIALITGLTALMLVSAGLNIAANAKFASYSSHNEVIALAETLEVDMSYTNEWLNKTFRMQHNDGEPIYVCFDDELTSQSKSAATEALDDIFGIVNEINPSYFYKVIEKNEYNKLFDKTKIYFEYGNVGEAMGHIAYNYDLLSLATNKQMIRDYTIKETDKNQYSLKYLYMHEILHAFGIDDVYSGTKLQGNTLINRYVGSRSEMLSPNDYKLLIALYAPPNATSSDIANYKMMASKYSTNYYNHISNIIKKDSKTNLSIESGDYFFESSSLIYDHQGVLQQHFFELTLQDGKYIFNIFDENHQLVDATSGNVEWQNGVAMLKDVKLKHGLYPLNPTIYYEDGLIDDFAIINTENGPALKQFSSPSTTYIGKLHQLEFEAQNS